MRRCSLDNQQDQIDHATQVVIVYLNELETKLRHKEAPDRNFSIRIEEHGGVHSVVLVRDDRIKNIGDFLPRGYQFEPGQLFACNLASRKVIFDSDKVMLRGFLLTLMHEIGHAHLGYPLPQLTCRQIATLFFGRIYRVMRERRLPFWYKELQWHMQATHERGAWAFALRKCVLLTREGFNVLSGFSSVHEVFDYISYHLLTYQLSLMAYIIKTQGLTEACKYQHLFDRRKRFGLSLTTEYLSIKS